MRPSAQGRSARILTRRRQYDDAIAMLHRVDVDKLRGYWRGSMLCAFGETLSAAGRKDEALAAYRKVLADDSVEKYHRNKAVRQLPEHGPRKKKTVVGLPHGNHVSQVMRGKAAMQSWEDINEDLDKQRDYCTIVTVTSPGANPWKS